MTRAPPQPDRPAGRRRCRSPSWPHRPPGSACAAAGTASSMARLRPIGARRREHEAVSGIEHAGEQGRDRHPRQIGHGDLRQDHRQLELDRIVDVAGIDHVHQPRHRQLAGDGDHDGRRGDGGQGVGGHPVGVGLAVAGQGPGVGGQEGRGEGALGEDPPKQVREGQRRGVGVCRRRQAGAQLGGDHQVSGRAHEPADQGQAGEDHGRADHAAARGRGGFNHAVSNAPLPGHAGPGALHARPALGGLLIVVAEDLGQGVL